MCPSLIQIGSKTAEKNSAQTNKQTDRQTDTTKIMVTWPWTNSCRFGSLQCSDLSQEIMRLADCREITAVYRHRGFRRQFFEASHHRAAHNRTRNGRRVVADGREQFCDHVTQISRCACALTTIDCIRLMFASGSVRACLRGGRRPTSKLASQH